jgi:hypothetical protein
VINAFEVHQNGVGLAIDGKKVQHLADTASGDHDRIANTELAAVGPLSVIGAFWTALQPGWVMTVPGMVAFAGWNVLVVAMAALALAVFRARAQECPTAAR